MAVLNCISLLGRKTVRKIWVIVVLTAWLVKKRNGNNIYLNMFKSMFANQLTCYLPARNILFHFRILKTPFLLTKVDAKVDASVGFNNQSRSKSLFVSYWQKWPHCVAFLADLTQRPVWSWGILYLRPHEPLETPLNSPERSKHLTVIYGAVPFFSNLPEFPIFIPIDAE